MKKESRRLPPKAAMVIMQFLMFNTLMFLAGKSFKEGITFFAVFALLNFTKNMYSFKSKLFWVELRRQLRVHGEVTGVILLIGVDLKDIGEIFSYIFIMSIFFIFNLLLLKGIRVWFRWLLKKNLLIIGTGHVARHIAETVSHNSFTMYNLVGYVDIRKKVKRFEGMIPDIAVPEEDILCTYDNLKSILKNNEIDEVIIAEPKASAGELRVLIETIEEMTDKIKFIPELNSLFTFNSEVEDYDSMLVISSTNGKITPMQSRLKRALDILGGLIGILLLGVLQIIYGRKIRKDGGPAMFTHPRLGIYFKEFKMYKFRTMCIDAEKKLEKMLAEDEALKKEFYTNFKLKNDPRVTPIGAFLRRTSLDEFPQLINVLKGEMSLIGPRPVVKKEVEMYYGDEVGKKVFKVKPGITGMWQTHGRSDVEDYDERIALDLYYIRNWSLWLDIVILIKTVKTVMKRSGAY